VNSLIGGPNGSGGDTTARSLTGPRGMILVRSPLPARRRWKRHMLEDFFVVPAAAQRLRSSLAVLSYRRARKLEPFLAAAEALWRSLESGVALAWSGSGPVTAVSVIQSWLREDTSMPDAREEAPQPWDAPGRA
jgi:hypothetical protein